MKKKISLVKLGANQLKTVKAGLEGGDGCEVGGRGTTCEFYRMGNCSAVVPSKACDNCLSPE